MTTSNTLSIPTLSLLLYGPEATFIPFHPSLQDKIRPCEPVWARGLKETPSRESQETGKQGELFGPFPFLLPWMWEYMKMWCLGLQQPSCNCEVSHKVSEDGEGKEESLWIPGWYHWAATPNLESCHWRLAVMGDTNMLLERKPLLGRCIVT